MKKYAADSLPNKFFPGFGWQSTVKVIAHWTAGPYFPGSFDFGHYHFLIDGHGSVIPDIPIGRPAPHTYGFNHEIGISLCCMAGARSGYKHGDFPMKKEQWESLKTLVAVIADRYNIPVQKDRILTHAEVTSVLGVDQWGKWDILELSFDKDVIKPGDDLRAAVSKMLQDDIPPVPIKVEVAPLTNIMLDGYRMNSQIWVSVRKLEQSNVLRILDVAPTHVKVGPACKKQSGSHIWAMMNEDGVGMVPVRKLETLGYVVSYKGSVVQCNLPKQ